jgi:hypothetical protein
MYAAGRFLFEPTREMVDRWHGWSVHRMISAALIAIAVTGLLLIWAL